MARGLPALFAVGLLLARPTPARAGEDEWQLSFAPAYALVDFDARTPSGVGAGVRLLRGLSDSWSVHVAASVSAHPTDAEKRENGLPEGTITVVGAFAGVRYAFDLLRTVPFVLRSGSSLCTGSVRSVVAGARGG